MELVNKYREVFGGETITDLSEKELKKNITPPATLAEKDKVNIPVLEKNILQLELVNSSEFQQSIRTLDQNLRNIVSQIYEDSNSLRAFSTQKLVSLGIEFLDDSGKCPLCDLQWKQGELEEHLNDKLQTIGVVKKQSSIIDTISKDLCEQVAELDSHLSRVISTTKLLKMENEQVALTEWQNILKKISELLRDPLIKYHKHPYTIEQMQRLLSPSGLDQLLTCVLNEASTRFPKSTPEQDAWDILTELGVAVGTLDNAQIAYGCGELFMSRALTLHDVFIGSRDGVLTDLYGEIKDRFVELYRDLHSDNENRFDATLEPSDAALDFEVDFYGRGSHPPHALHSEGYQDSMGVCLFLALSEKLTRGVIDLIILDDVVMSVDWHHRRELCRVLAENFQ